MGRATKLVRRSSHNLLHRHHIHTLAYIKMTKPMKTELSHADMDGLVSAIAWYLRDDEATKALILYLFSKKWTKKEVLVGRNPEGFPKQPGTDFSELISVVCSIHPIVCCVRRKWLRELNLGGSMSRSVLSLPRLHEHTFFTGEWTTFVKSLVDRWRPSAYEELIKLPSKNRTSALTKFVARGLHVLAGTLPPHFEPKKHKSALWMNERASANASYALRYKELIATAQQKASVPLTFEERLAEIR